MFQRLCKMFSESSPCLLGQHGSGSTVQQPVELPKNRLQNFRNKSSPQTVDESFIGQLNATFIHQCSVSEQRKCLPLLSSMPKFYFIVPGSRSAASLAAVPFAARIWTSSRCCCCSRRRCSQSSSCCRHRGTTAAAEGIISGANSYLGGCVNPVTLS